MKRKAFTLIELLIVVAIIAILAAIAVPNFLEAQVRSKVSASKADIRSLSTALEAYSLDYNSYAFYPDDDVDEFVATNAFGSAEPQTVAYWRGFTPRSLTTPIAYMTSVPKDVFANAKGYGNNPEITDEVKNSDYAKNALHLYHYEHAKSPATFSNWSKTMPETVKYQVVGVGPDLFAEINTTGFHNNAAEFLENREAAMGSLFGFYDPTNGIVSRGDIVFHGPGIGFDRSILRTPEKKTP